MNNFNHFHLVFRTCKWSNTEYKCHITSFLLKNFNFWNVFTFNSWEKGVGQRVMVSNRMLNMHLSLLADAVERACADHFFTTCTACANSKISGVFTLCWKIVTVNWASSNKLLFYTQLTLTICCRMLSVRKPFVTVCSVYAYRAEHMLIVKIWLRLF